MQKIIKLNANHHLFTVSRSDAWGKRCWWLGRKQVRGGQGRTQARTIEEERESKEDEVRMHERRYVNQIPNPILSQLTNQVNPKTNCKTCGPHPFSPKPLNCLFTPFLILDTFFYLCFFSLFFRVH